MVLLLWDRWGSPTGSETFSSGTEEEFHQGLKCIGDASLPMRDILVLFKAVDERQLRDPGPQLSMVLTFKTDLEQSKQVLFHTFDTPDDLKRRLQQALNNWMTPLDTKTPKVISLAASSATGIGAILPSLTSLTLQQLVAKADEMESAGMITQAEAAYAQAVSSDEPEYLLKFARFMRRTGRLDRAYQVNEKILSLSAFIASDAPERVAQRADVLTNMGLIRRKQGRLHDSRSKLQEAVQTARTSGPLGRKELGYALDNLGLTLLRQGEVSKACAAYEEALELRRLGADKRGEAQSLLNLARARKQTGDLESASRLTTEAITLLEGLQEEPGMANAASVLGEISVARGLPAEAKVHFEKALDINEKLRLHICFRTIHIRADSRRTAHLQEAI